MHDPDCSLSINALNYEHASSSTDIQRGIKVPKNGNCGVGNRSRIYDVLSNPIGFAHSLSQSLIICNMLQYALSVLKLLVYIQSFP